MDTNWRVEYRGKKPYGIRNDSGYYLFFREVFLFDGQVERYKQEVKELDDVVQVVLAALRQARWPEGE